MPSISESLAPLEEACVRGGFGANIGLVAVDECGWMFSLVTFGRAPAEGSFDLFGAGFGMLAMLM